MTRASATCRLRSTLLGGVCAAALALVMAAPQAAHAEPTPDEIMLGLGPIAGADGIVSETELRDWIATLPSTEQPTPQEIDQFIDSLPTTGTGAGEREFALDAIAQAVTVMQSDNGGYSAVASASPPDSGRVTGAEVTLALVALAGPDGLLSREEVHAWAASLPAAEGATPAAVDQFLATLTPDASGQYDVRATVRELNQWNDDPDGSGGLGTGPNGQGSPTDPPVCVPRNSTWLECFHRYTGQVSVSVTGAGQEVFLHNETPIRTVLNFQPGIVFQVQSTAANPGWTMDYDHPAMILDNVADITTTGSGSAGITAWGGNGSIRVGNTGNISAAGGNSGGIVVYTGQFNIGGPGGDITIVNTGNMTVGVNSAGIMAQSGPLDDGGDISITNTGAISSGGWAAIAAQTFGGDISVTNSGALTAVGDWAAIAVRTEGGSAIVNNTGEISVTGAGAGGISVEAEEKAIDQDNRPTQSADINNAGNINLLGEEQNGLEAYAFNGQATVVNSGQISSSQYWATGISVDAGNEDSSASAATVLHSGTIALTGASSTGIQATTPLGTVNVQNRGTVRATGDNSIGVFTVGAFGGSALINNDGGTIVGGSGATTFGTDGDNSGGGTAFTGSAGILMLGSDINTIYNSGTITSLNGQAVATFEGALTVYEWDDEQQQQVPFTLDIPVADTTIYNRAAGLIDGNIRLGSGDDRIFNAGAITGDIDMAGGANLLENAAGGILTGSSIIVGAGNTFSNAGTLSPGGTGVIAETIVVGNFVQTAGGRMVIDINETAGVRSDSINVSGTAALAGTVTPNVIDLGQVVEAEYRILTAAGGVTDNGIVADPNQVQVSDTVGYDFGLEQRGANELYLTAQSQKSASEIAAEASEATGATGQTAQNMAALGDTLDQLEQSGDDKTLPVLNALRLQDGPANAARVMDRLIPQQQGEQAGGAVRSGASFGNAMLSCASRDGEYAYTREGKCYYAKLTVRRLDHDASASGAGVKETSTEAMGGIQFGIGGERRLGLAFGYEDINSKAFSPTQGLGSSEGQRFQGGIVLKDQWGPINAYLNIAGSYGEHDNKRFVNLGGFTNALAEQEVMSGLIKLRLSYLRDMGGWYVKPLVDVGASYIHLGGYTETGAGAFNLRVATTEKWLFSVMPGLELGGEIRDGGGTIWRPYIRAGVTLFNDDGLNVSAGFADAPAGVGGFNVATQLDTIYADVDAGMHVLTTSGLNLRFNYEGRYGESTRMHAGTVKFSLPY